MSPAPQRVLVVAKYQPSGPPSGGTARLRSTLAALGSVFDVRVVGYRERSRPRPRSRAVGLGVALATRTPYQVARWEGRGLREAISRELREFRPHAVHVTATALARAGLSAPTATVLDMMDVESSLAAEGAGISTGIRRWLIEREAEALSRLEARCCREIDLVVVSSRREAERLGCPAAVVPNGVTPPDRPPESPGIPGRIVFVGLMSWWPNVDGAAWLAREVLPKLPAGAKLDVVGRDPPRALRRLSGPQVTVTEEVAEVAPYLAAASVVVVPLRARAGTRLKVLEGLAYARPVVATPEGADGLEDLIGEGLVIGHGAAGMASCIRALLDDPAHAVALGQAGRRAVLERYAWTRSEERLLALYRERLGLG